MPFLGIKGEPSLIKNTFTISPKSKVVTRRKKYAKVQGSNRSVNFVALNKDKQIILREDINSPNVYE